MRFLRFAARWCGPALVSIGLILVLTNYMLLRILLPFRLLVVAFALLGGVASAVAWRNGRKTTARPRRVVQSVLLVFAVAGLVLGLWRYDAEYLAYRETPIRFENQGVLLAATIYRPKGRGPFPGIVLVHGSGKFPRRFYHVWADHFVRRGYEVLIYDKRGAGGSGGDYEGHNNTSRANIELLASDASAALTALAARPEVRSNATGFWGISQAGWIVPRACVLNGHCAFMLLVSGPVSTVREENEYSDVTGDENPGKGMTPQQAEQMMAQRPSGGYDPIPDLRSLNVPGFWLQGDQDWSIPVFRSVRLLDQLIHEDHKPYQYRVFHGAGHAIFLPPKRGERIVPEVAPGYWQAMDEWLTRVTEQQ